MHFQPTCNPLPAASPAPTQGNNGSGATLAEKAELKIDLWRAKIRGATFRESVVLFGLLTGIFCAKCKVTVFIALDSLSTPEGSILPSLTGKWKVTNPFLLLIYIYSYATYSPITIPCFSGCLPNDRRCSCIYKASLRSFHFFFRNSFL